MPELHPLIRIVIFDLDDTLYDCLHQRVEVAHRAAAEAAVKAGVKATVDEVLALRMKAFLTDPQLRKIDAEVARAFNVENAEAVSHAAHMAYFSCPVGALTLFPGSLNVLRTLQQRGVRNFIVSFGDSETQKQKIAALKLDHEKSITGIFYADRQKKLTKEMAIHNIQQQTTIPPEQILVAGDRVSSEIAAGNKLGMHTARIKGGEFASLNPTQPAEQPEFEIEKIEELLALPFHFGERS